MDTNHLDLMEGGDVLIIAKKIVDQSWDKYRVGRKLGGQDELLQTVAEILLQVRSGKVVFDLARGVSFAGFVSDKARWTAKENWMLEAPRKRPEPAQPGAPADSDSDGDNGEVEAARLQTVTPPAGGADAQAESDIKLDGHAEWALGLFDDFGDEDEDALTPAHRLLKQSDTLALAGLLGCTDRTIYNMLARSKDRQELSEKAARLKNTINK